ncbi:MAG: asparagine--tRNA ligase [Patescibacteria group bacterium]|nr:MAG: asparagine--tRNA ligase [Patescibacteria group bacterium]
MEKDIKKTYIKDLASFLGETVKINGWVYNFRSSGKIAFWQIRDGSGFCQAVLVEDELSKELWTKAGQVTQETSVCLTGLVTKHPKKEEYEIQISDFDFYQIAEEYPIAKKEHGVDFLLQNRHLWLRSNKQWAIMRVRDTLIRATYDFMKEHNVTKIDSPIVTANAGENTTDLFKIQYFEETAYLSQTGQLYLEAAIAAHGRVFDFGPTFRAEKSKTRRHLTEFWMMDAELAFIDLEDNLNFQEELIRYMVKKVLEDNVKELEILERDTTVLNNIDKPFHRLTHQEAVKKLQTLGSDIKDRDDLGADDETKLTESYDNPIFITHYPAEVKAFYMKRDEQDNSRVLGADLLAPEGYGEIIGGSQREEDYETLKRQLEEFGLKPEDYEWYLELRKYGSVPHGGFGFGLERIVAWVCGLEHIREAIPFPRTIYRIRP